MIFFTIICSNYIAQARVLAQSLKKYNPQVKFIVCLIEKSQYPQLNTEYIDEVILVKALDIKDLDVFLFKHSVVEASTAVKGYCFKKLLKIYPYESKFVFLDPDILVTGSFNQLDKILSSFNIVVVPHMTEPEDHLADINNNEICSLRHGVFNLGFLAIKRSDETLKFLNWWTKRLNQFCYIDYPNGLFTDQRWMDLAICFFPIYIFKNPGYDVATWNLSHRKIIKSKDGKYTVFNQPLIFFHFSGWKSGANEAVMLKYTDKDYDTVKELKSLYSNLLNENGYKEINILPWTFNYYSNGKRIEEKQRVFYRSYKRLQNKFKRPFNVEANFSFYDYIQNPFHKLLPLGYNLDDLFNKILKIYKKGGLSMVFRNIQLYLKLKLYINRYH